MIGRATVPVVPGAVGRRQRSVPLPLVGIPSSIGPAKRATNQAHQRISTVSLPCLLYDAGSAQALPVMRVHEWRQLCRSPAIAIEGWQLGVTRSPCRLPAACSASVIVWVMSACLQLACTHADAQPRPKLQNIGTHRRRPRAGTPRLAWRAQSAGGDRSRRSCRAAADPGAHA